MKLTPQQLQILSLHEDGAWHCSTEVEYIRHQGKRVSELNKMGWVFESKPCNLHTNHLSKVLGMRRLVSAPEVQSKCCYWFSKFGDAHSADCPKLVAEKINSKVEDSKNTLKFN